MSPNCPIADNGPNGDLRASIPNDARLCSMKSCATGLLHLSWKSPTLFEQRSTRDRIMILRAGPMRRAPERGRLTRFCFWPLGGLNGRRSQCARRTLLFRPELIRSPYGDGMRRREFITALGALAMWPRGARAQTAPLPVIGLLTLARPDWVMNAIRAGLEEGGYVEERNFTFMMRSADGQFDHLPALVSQLVDSRVAVIFATGSPVPARTAKAATTTIPIVFAYG